MTRQNCSMDLREDTLCSESMITKGISTATGSTEGQKGCHLSALSTLSSTLFTDQNTGLYESPFTDSPRFFHRFRSSFSSARKAHHSPSGHRGEEALRPGNISRNFCVVTREFCIAFDPPQAGRKGSFFHAVTIRVSGAVFAIDVTRCSNLDPTNRSRSRCH